MSIHKFSVRPTDPDADVPLRHLREHLGLPDLVVWRDYYLEFDAPISDGAIDELRRALADPVTETVVHDAPVVAGRMVQVTYQRGILDNEHETLVGVGRMLGLPAIAGKVAHSYESGSPQLAAVVREEFVNPNIEELRTAELDVDSLALAGRAVPTEVVDLRDLDDDALLAAVRGNGRNLDLRQARHIRMIQTELGLDGITDVLLEALDARWSDHCAHTTWKSLGSLLRVLRDASVATQNPNILSMFSDNAGVWRLTDDWAIAVKAETHNGPSAVSAYFGQLTKIGGVLRDILGTGLGADPIGVFEYTATGVPGTPAPIAGRPDPGHIARDTIRAVKEYGNTFGVPMMSSRMAFHPKYRAKPFALGGSIGLIPTASAQQGTAQPGDLVVLIGALTGNEGIHGASASSAGATMDEAAVQIGSPLEEVKFRGAIIDLRDAGLTRAITDMGAAGLNSAVGEMGDPGGVWLNTALVPLKTSALPTWRILLSESQERMVLAIPRDRLTDARRILARHEVRTVVVGVFTDTGRYTVVHRPDLDEQWVVDADRASLPSDDGDGFDVPYSLLEYDPVDCTVGPPSPRAITPAAWPNVIPRASDLMVSLLGDARVASQRVADAQYDSSVQGNTRIGPTYGAPHRIRTSYWAGTPVPGSPAAAVFATAFDPWCFDLDPVIATRQMFVRLLTTYALAGVPLTDVCLCDNFYTPHLEADSDAWLVAMVHECAALVRRFGTPLVSGKDSSAGSVATDDGLVHVPPAVYFSGLGAAADWRALRTNAWQRAGNVIVLVGPRTPSMAGTVAAGLFDTPGGFLDDIDLDHAHASLLALGGVSTDVAPSGQPVGPGGILATVALAALGSGIGIDLEPHPLTDLLAEHRAGALLEVLPDAVGSLPDALDAVVIGRLSEAPGVRLEGESLLTDRAVAAWTTTFAEALER